jgi:hypothetical protein
MSAQLQQVPTGNGSPDLFRDSEGRAYWSDGGRVLARDLERDETGLLADCLREFGLSALGHGGSEVRP